MAYMQACHIALAHTLGYPLPTLPTLPPIIALGPTEASIEAPIEASIEGSTTGEEGKMASHEKRGQSEDRVQPPDGTRAPPAQPPSAASKSSFGSPCACFQSCHSEAMYYPAWEGFPTPYNTVSM